MNLFRRLFHPPDGKSCWVLLDPDSLTLSELVDLAVGCERSGAAAVLVGGSFIVRDGFDRLVAALKGAVKVPVVLFPGDSRQVSPYADGMLFLSLLSGRNPQYLIGEQVQAAPLIMKLGLAAVPTAYLLIESGTMTSAEYVSNTKPLPRDKPVLAVAHAQAAQLLGMKAVYLEAGSGAGTSVPEATVRAVAEAVSLPVIVGGGITAAGSALNLLRSGARAVVIGNALATQGPVLVRKIVEGLKADPTLTVGILKGGKARK